LGQYIDRPVGTLDISENEPETLMQQDADINCRRCLLISGIVHRYDADTRGRTKESSFIFGVRGGELKRPNPDKTSPIV